MKINRRKNTFSFRVQRYAFLFDYNNLHGLYMVYLTYNDPYTKKGIHFCVKCNL